MTVNYAKHKSILLQILKDIFFDSSIAPHLGFKGGTAAYLFYGLNRDSFDLDFDLLNEEKEEEVFLKIQEIVKKYGTVVESKIKKNNLLNIISYNKDSQNIKVEVNRRNFGSQFEIKNLLGISMCVMTKEDMFAHKLMAMLERIGKTSRDVYDVWYFLENNWPINKDIVEKRSGISFKETLQKCISQIEAIKDRDLLLGLGEALSGPQKDWVRAKLREEIIFLLRVRMENNE